MTGGFSRNGELSRRGLLALAAGSATALSGCGYRPGGGDLRWEFGTGTGTYRPDDVLASGGSENRRSPADGTVFTVNRSHRGYDFEAEQWGESAQITAYDAASGEERWEESTKPCGRPAARAGTLYLGHEDGGLTALGPDGSVDWRASLSDFPHALAPAADRVYALTTAGDLVAVAAGGEEVWSVGVGSDDQQTERTRLEKTLAATENGPIVHYESDGVGTTVAAFRRDGEVRWTAELTDDLGDRRLIGSEGRPVVGDDAVFVSTERSLVALSLRDGSEQWSSSVGRARGSPAVADGSVYHVGERTLYARNAANGQVRWEFEPTDLSGFAGPPAVADGSVYAPGREWLFALTAEDGSVRWKVESENVDSRPSVVGETVVVATDDGAVRGHRRA